jgi:hypothetical protein
MVYRLSRLISIDQTGNVGRLIPQDRNRWSGNVSITRVTLCSTQRHHLCRCYVTPAARLLAISSAKPVNLLVT